MILFLLAQDFFLESLRICSQLRRLSLLNGIIGECFLEFLPDSLEPFKIPQKISMLLWSFFRIFFCGDSFRLSKIIRWLVGIGLGFSNVCFYYLFQFIKLC